MTDAEDTAEPAAENEPETDDPGNAWASPLVEADEYHRLPENIRKETIEKGVDQEKRFTAGETRRRKQIIKWAAWSGGVNLILTIATYRYMGLKLVPIVITGMILGGLIAAYRLNQVISAVVFGLGSIIVLMIVFAVPNPLVFFGWLFLICWGALAATWMETTE